VGCGVEHDGGLGGGFGGDVGDSQVDLFPASCLAVDGDSLVDVGVVADQYDGVAS
jgi:hypothetical protein